MAACQLGLRRLDELFAKFGRNVVLHSVERIFADTEAKCRKAQWLAVHGLYLPIAHE